MDEVRDRLETAEAVREEVESFASVLERADANLLDQPLGSGGWRRRDALAHIVWWHEKCLWAINSTIAGTYERVDLSDVDAVNAQAVKSKEHLDTQDLVTAFRTTGMQIVDAIKNVPEELWKEKPRLAGWVDGCTLRHYGEHVPEMEAAVPT